MENVDQQKLVEEAREGDQEAFRTLVRNHSRRIQAIAYQMCGNSEDARDITQEVFVRLHKSLKSYDPGYLFTTWLYRITVNLAIDHMRRTERHKHEDLDMTEGNPSLTDSSPRPDQQAESSELRGAINRLAGELSDQQRSVFVLRDLQGFTTDEIADILKCRLSTVRVHLARARHHIRQALTDQYPEYAEEAEEAGGADR